MGNKHFPVLQLRIVASGLQTPPVDVDAHLDSGAELSLFQGWIPRAIGLDILSGRTRKYYPVNKQEIEARVLPVRLFHDRLGAFEMEIGFSLAGIKRNLLGRDFFDLIQIGFREHQITLYITAKP